jgi:signal peptidase I
VNENPQDPFDDRPDVPAAAPPPLQARPEPARVTTEHEPPRPEPTEPPTTEDGATPSETTAAETTDVETAGDKKTTSNTRKTVIEWVVLIGAALLIALVVKAFLFQAFYIPSDSMVPTLKTNDRVIVNKLSYKLHPVHRGDIVVFKTPKGADGKPIDPTIKDLIKRVIGLPGETISARNGQVTINGKPLVESYLPKGTVTDCEKFVPDCFPKGPLPSNEYFVMGDNRGGSRDSRYFGPISKGEIVGRAFIRVWPLSRIGFL